MLSEAMYLQAFALWTAACKNSQPVTLSTFQLPSFSLLSWKINKSNTTYMFLHLVSDGSADLQVLPQGTVQDEVERLHSLGQIFTHTGTNLQRDSNDIMSAIPFPLLLFSFLKGDLPPSTPFTQPPFATPLDSCMVTDNFSRRVTARSKRSIKPSMITDLTTKAEVVPLPLHILSEQTFITTYKVHCNELAVCGINRDHTKYCKERRIINKDKSFYI